MLSDQTKDLSVTVKMVPKPTVKKAATLAIVVDIIGKKHEVKEDAKIDDLNDKCEFYGICQAKAKFVITEVSRGKVSTLYGVGRNIEESHTALSTQPISTCKQFKVTKINMSVSDGFQNA